MRHIYEIYDKDKWKPATWETVGIFGNIYIYILQPYNKIIRIGILKIITRLTFPSFFNFILRIISTIKNSTLKNKKLDAINMNIITKFQKNSVVLSHEFTIKY